jgi:hypothetical protein
MVIFNDTFWSFFSGLGSNLNDICGKDWVFGGGDHGDPGTELLVFMSIFCYRHNMQFICPVLWKTISLHHVQI